MNESDPLKVENLTNGEVDMQQNEEYEHQYTTHSSLNDFSNLGAMNVCGLCGALGKLFIQVEENIELTSYIKKYMPFVNMQNHFSDCICYQCSSQLNSWNGFYRNCSTVNSKFNPESSALAPGTERRRSNKKQNIASNSDPENPVDKICESYNCLEENPSTENITRTMNILTDCLKSLIAQLKTVPSISTDKNPRGVSLIGGDNEDDENSSEFLRMVRPVDVIEVDLSESDIDNDTKSTKPLKRVHQVQSHHGVVFYDEDGYAYRVNKKQPGKLYVRCSDNKCPVRGSIFGNSFRCNKHTHNHPPCVSQDGRFLKPKERVIEVGVWA
ncbi:uncharacterized protein LOC135835600 [Planococcus citri]|uniref:uncharacterized protein LOC135835600 n=1 Tax=Planococcus citri TaxID=170843 RepID=UPI0031FA2128